MEELGDEAIVEPAKAIGAAATAFYNNPLKALKEAGKAILKRFDACVKRKTIAIVPPAKAEPAHPENFFGDTPGFTKSSGQENF